MYVIEWKWEEKREKYTVARSLKRTHIRVSTMDLIWTGIETTTESTGVSGECVYVFYLYLRVMRKVKYASIEIFGKMWTQNPNKNKTNKYIYSVTLRCYWTFWKLLWKAIKQLAMPICDTISSFWVFGVCFFVFIFFQMKKCEIANLL